MKFRFGDKSGTEVPPLTQSLEDLQTLLAQKQKQWAEQLGRDPAYRLDGDTLTTCIDHRIDLKEPPPDFTGRVDQTLSVYKRKKP